MKRAISDSITIKVGHGIMTIPRNLEKIKKQKHFPDKNEKFSETANSSTQ